MEEHLYVRYNKEFEVTQITYREPGGSLGDSWDVVGTAHPKDDSGLEFSIQRDHGIGLFDLNWRPPYSDTYLPQYWLQQDSPVTDAKLKEIFATEMPKVSRTAGSTMEGDSKVHGVIALDDMLKNHSDTTKWRFDITRGIVGDNTITSNSQHLYDLVMYTRDRYKGRAALAYTYETSQDTYRCSLDNFIYKFIESARQLEGCWSKTSKTPETSRPSGMYTPPLPTVVEPWAEALPIKTKHTRFTLTQTETLPGATGSYVARDVNSQTEVRVSIYDGGYGDMVDRNGQREELAHQWLSEKIPINAQSTLLLKREGYESQTAVYRADTSQDNRSLYYVKIFKNFTVLIDAKTVDGESDLRDEEFNILSLVKRIEPVDIMEAR